MSDKENIKVVILCGGAGTRLGEETEYLPKPMVEIGGKPILWHIMKIYGHYGFQDFILCLGHKGGVIKTYFYNYEIINADFSISLGDEKKITAFNDNRERDWRIAMIDTGELSLKGYRIKKIEKLIDGDIFMLTYGDGVAHIDLNDLLRFHRSHKRIGTVTGVRPPSRFGELVVEKGKVVTFNEKPQVSKGLINGGFFVFDRRFFNYLSLDEGCDFEMGALEKLAMDGELMVFELKGEWMCMDTRRDLEYLTKLWHTGKAFWKVWEE